MLEKVNTIREVASMTKADKAVVNALLEAVKIIVCSEMTQAEKENALEQIQDVLTVKCI